ncbi:MAG: hypothetical protein K5656_08275 [Lachnospiraceae bacterium]|nr:hypothetical protein [Lachnospiraceae bacterium]
MSLNIYDKVVKVDSYNEDGADIVNEARPDRKPDKKPDKAPEPPNDAS